MGTTVQLTLLCALTCAGLVACSTSYCWTKWLNRDDPTGTGDYETLPHFPQSQVCPQPVGIQCQTTSGQPYQSTGENFAANCEPREGLICKKSEQNDGTCQDYRVRFLCPYGTIQDTSGISCVSYCNTHWLDRDNPSGSCDCETLQSFSHSQTCPNPVGVRCREKSTGLDYQDVGQTMVCNTHRGGVCYNHDNDPPCKDYEIQFICPCATSSGPGPLIPTGLN